MIRRKLDREKLPMYNLVAKVEDGGGRFCEVVVFVSVTDTNDESPVFQQQFYKTEIGENFDGKFPHFVQQIVAIDNDLR